MQSDTERQELRRNIKEAAAAHDAAAVLQHGRNLLAASSKPADVMFCASTFNSMADDLTNQLRSRHLKTYIVRSVTVEPILPFLTTEAVLSNYVLDLQVGGYGSYVDELLNPQSALAKAKPDLVCILLDLEDVAGSLPDLCADGIGAAVETEIEESGGAHRAAAQKAFAPATRLAFSSRALLCPMLARSATSARQIFPMASAMPCND